MVLPRLNADGYYLYVMCFKKSFMYCYFMCLGVLSAYMYVHHVHAWGLWKPEGQ